MGGILMPEKGTVFLHVKFSLAPDMTQYGMLIPHRLDPKTVERTAFLTAALWLLSTFLFPHNLQAQGSEDLKRGVVKITARGKGQQLKVGTGVVVRVDKDVVYIVTVAHVIEGDPKPTVTFFPHAQQSLVAQVVGIQGGDQHGLAALRVAGRTPDRIVALPLDLTTKVVGGEALTFIGFPRTLPPWTVSTGSVSGMNGPTLAFQALVEEGHSGGPLLLNEQVIGVSDAEVGRGMPYRHRFLPLLSVDGGLRRVRVNRWCPQRSLASMVCPWC